jgi:NAD+ diphosphatase
MSHDRSTPNFLAGPYIDRRAEVREHDDWLAEARRDPQTIFLLASGTALSVRSEQAVAAFVDGNHPLVAGAAAESLILLGWFRQTRCVLVQLDPQIEPPAGIRFEELRPLASELDANEAGLLAYARALTFWQRRHRHCGVCGAVALPLRAGHVMHCSNERCASDFFPRIDPAIIVLVSDGERALLGRQASWAPGRYSTIAGFVEPGESLEDAVAREVLEETGVRVDSSRYHSSQPWPFPSALMLGFMASAAAGSTPQAASELQDARWFSAAEIAAGKAILPPPTSISHRLIASWFDAHWSEPLASLEGVVWR